MRNGLTPASTTAASSTSYQHQLTYSMLGNISAFSTTTGATSTYAYAETNYANPHAVTSVAGGDLQLQLFRREKEKNDSSYGPPICIQSAPSTVLGEGRLTAGRSADPWNGGPS
jgi:hypothetical protein